MDLFDDETESPRAMTPKERELTRIKNRFSAWESGFSSSGLEEDEAIERVNEAFEDLISLQSR